MTTTTTTTVTRVTRKDGLEEAPFQASELLHSEDREDLDSAGHKNGGVPAINRPHLLGGGAKGHSETFFVEEGLHYTPVTSFKDFENGAMNGKKERSSSLAGDCPLRPAGSAAPARFNPPFNPQAMYSTRHRPASRSEPGRVDDMLGQEADNAYGEEGDDVWEDYDDDGDSYEFGGWSQ